MADIKNFGIKGLNSDVQMGKSGGRLKYDSGNSRFDFTQSDGSTLENIRFGSVVSGTWTGTAIDPQYGGTGQDFSSATGIVQFSSGTASAANISLSDANLIDTNSQLAVAQGGTGASTASGARTNLGLGSIATQNANNVSITGGTLDGVVIGGTTAGAITGTTITASSGFTGDLTGTADDADALSSAVTINLSSDATGSATFTNAGDQANISVTLANTGVTAGSVGSATQIPVLTIDSKGRITATSTAAIATSFDIAGDNGANDTVNTGETLSIVGVANQTETTITNNQVAVGIVDGASIANLTVTGTFTSDDITSSAISIDGDATITGNLTVQGTQTTVNSTTVETADAIFRTNSNGANTNAGFEANTANGVKQILYTSVGQEWDFGSENVKASSFEGALTGNVTGNLTGDVTGTVSDISNHSTTDLSEGTNLYWTTARGNAAMDAYLTGGTGIDYATGTIDLADTAVTPGSYGNATAIPQITVDQQGRITSAGTTAISTSWTLTGDSGSQTVNGGDTVDIAGGTNITTVAGATDTLTVNLDSDISLTNVTISDTFTDGAMSISSGAITGATTGAFSGNVSASTFVGNVNGTFVTASGAVTGGSLTDGTATLSSGALSGATTGTFSGAVTGGSLTDGTLTASSGAITGATNITASGTVQYGSLSDGSITITGFVDEDNMASDSAALVPTQQSVKAYVDAQLTAQDLDFAGDSGGDLAIDLDSEKLTIAGGTNITTAGSGNTLTVNLDSDISLTNVTVSDTFTDGTLSISGGAISGATSIATSGDVTVGGNLTVSGTTTSVNSTNTTISDTLVVLQSGLSGANPNDIGHIYERGTDGDNGFLGWDQSVDRFIAATTTADGSGTGDLSLTATDFEAAGLIGSSATISGAVSFGSLTDSGESITVTKFVDQADGISSNDNDTTLPTSAAVKDYVDTNGGDGLLLRQALTSGSTTIDTSAMPNVSTRTYYAQKIVIKIGTAFSGGNFNHILVKENAGSGTTLVAADDADAATAGTYIIELDGDQTLTKNAAVQVQFMQADGTTAATTTAGSGTISVHYNYV